MARIDRIVARIQGADRKPTILTRVVAAPRGFRLFLKQPIMSAPHHKFGSVWWRLAIDTIYARRKREAAKAGS
jgi:hypothetical protein